MKAPPPSDAAYRILKYLDEIDRRGGRASRMDWLRIAGNEANLERYIRFLSGHGFISIKQDSDRLFYVKTEKGEKFHNILKDSDSVGILTQELSGRRLRRRF